MWGMIMNTIRNYLSELIRSQLNGQQPSEVPVGISVEELIQIARQHHMNYLILGALLKLDLNEEQKSIIQYYVVNAVAKSIYQITELKKLEELFEIEKIHNHPLKGAYMKFLYPSPEMREMSDIDILVPMEDFDRASELLLEMGYTLSEKSYHHDKFIKPPYMIIEVHRQMYDGQVDKNQEEYFTDRSRVKQKEGCYYTYCLGAEDFYIFMISHFAKHFYKRGCGIRNIIDIHVFLQRYEKSMDKKYLQEEFVKCGLWDFVKHMEELSDIWLNGKPGSIYYEQLFDYMLECGIYGKDEYGIWNKFTEHMNTKQNRLRLLIWYVFPPRKYLLQYYPWLKKNIFLLPIAWIVRGANGFVYNKGKQKRKMINEIDDKKIVIISDIYKKFNFKFINHKEI